MRFWPTTSAVVLTAPEAPMHTNPFHTSRHLLQRLAAPAVFYLCYVVGIYYLYAVQGLKSIDLTMAIAYLRDLALDLYIISESMEAFVPYTTLPFIFHRLTNAICEAYMDAKLPTMNSKLPTGA